MEPVFGQIKQGRGFRQFLLRGVEKVGREWQLICTGDNLLKLFRFGAVPPAKVRGNSPAVKGDVKESPWTVGSTIFKRLSARLHLRPVGIVVVNCSSRLLRNPG